MKTKLTMSLMAACFTAMLVVLSCSKTGEEKASLSGQAAFWNLTGNIVAHDPCIIKEGSTWWSFQTGTGIGVKYSSDGRNWTQGVRIFANELSWWRQYAPNMGSNSAYRPARWTLASVYAMGNFG
ncbi:MAG: hypothetical protein ACP5PZ_05680 [Bacteroidales bacterium]